MTKNKSFFCEILIFDFFCLLGCRPNLRSFGTLLLRFFNFSLRLGLCGVCLIRLRTSLVKNQTLIPHSAPFNSAFISLAFGREPIFYVNAGGKLYPKKYFCTAPYFASSAKADSQTLLQASPNRKRRNPMR